MAQTSSSCLSGPRYEAFLGYGSLALAQLSCAVIGPMFKWLYEHGVEMGLGIIWRCTMMALVLFPAALVEYRCLSTEAKQRMWQFQNEDSRISLPWLVVGCGITWAGNLLSWAYALEYLTTTISSIVTNSTPIIMVIYYRMTGVNVSVMEWIGVFGAFAGMCLATFDRTGGEDAGNPPKGATLAGQMIGFTLCMFSSMISIPNTFWTHTTKKRVPLFIFSFLTTCIVVLCAMISSLIFEKDVTFDNKPSGMFGWASKEYFITILGFALVVGFFTICGYNYALNYVSPMVFSMARLVDSFLTGLTSWLVGLEGVPGPLVFVGGIIAMCGGYMVIIGEEARLKHAAHALLPLNAESASGGTTNMPDSSVELATMGGGEDDDDEFELPPGPEIYKDETVEEESRSTNSTSSSFDPLAFNNTDMSAVRSPTLMGHPMSLYNSSRNGGFHRLHSDE
jgi:drug/metabolite transporter (DMT)-like permease